MEKFNCQKKFRMEREIESETNWLRERKIQRKKERKKEEKERKVPKLLNLFSSSLAVGLNKLVCLSMETFLRHTNI